ncbi:MAG: 16S rRNA (adenine(1518)-N(6)/adenine(1519)-N(6))-dimethyltransferase RsmA [Firmicutes bacterium]|nr:16S rRNA (adenine(1518)-N(6)/adenine(1519)-N(6))-dimethyltransferase RsmA [Bacillota bacterium]
MSEPLYTPSVARKVLERHGFVIKKSFGQNFLIDRHVLDDIVEAAMEGDEPGRSHKVAIEIGPGIGTLTQALAESEFQPVIAIEKDRHLIPLLADTLADYPHVHVVSGDALEVDFTELLSPFIETSALAQASLRLVANLPYYITTPLIMRVLEARWPLHSAVVMVQKEVAKRMVASPGTKDYGALTVAVRYYSHPTLVRIVSPGCFLPNPGVDSAVVRLLIRDEPVASDVPRELFFRVVRAAFGQRRKTLANALRSEFTELSRDDVDTWFADAGIDGVRRGETLSMEEFVQLGRSFLTR